MTEPLPPSTCTFSAMALNQEEESWKLPSSVTPASSIKASQVTEEEEEEDMEEEDEEDTEEEEEEDLATLSSSSSSSCCVLPFSFSSSMTGQTVLERLMQPHTSDASSVSSRRNSHHQSSCSAPPHCFLLGDDGASRPPFIMSPTHTDDLSKWLLLQQAVHPDQLGTVNHLQGNKSCCQSSSGVRVPPKSGMSMRRWLKDTKERKKEAMRVHTSQVHAALSVAGVAAAVAAIVASTTSLSSLNDDGGGNMNTNKKKNMNMTSSAAVASAAALVAAQCVEIAKSMGANHERVSSVLNSAINVKTPGDVRTLTASAATALRAAETLKARAIRNNPSQATVIPYERACGYPTPHYSSGELASEDSEVEFANQDFLRRGHEFLKRTRKGELHWRVLSVYINKESQVIVKSQGKYMGGTLTKSKKRIVVDVILDIPAWPGRDLLDNASGKKYFGIKTIMGMMELESKNETEYQLWTKGISHLLSLAQHRRVRQE